MACAVGRRTRRTPLLLNPATSNDMLSESYNQPWCATLRTPGGPSLGIVTRSRCGQLRRSVMESPPSARIHSKCRTFVSQELLARTVRGSGGERPSVLDGMCLRALIQSDVRRHPITGIFLFSDLRARSVVYFLIYRESYLDTPTFVTSHISLQITYRWRTVVEGGAHLTASLHVK